MRHNLLATLALMLVFHPTGWAQQPTKGRIEGTVVSSATGRPIQGAQVIVSKGSGPARPSVAEAFATAMASDGPPDLALETMIRGGGPRPPNGLTSDDGKFSFDLDPGTYRIAVSANNYSPGEFGLRAAHGTGTVIYLEPDQMVSGLSVSLIPTGVVTGRITDSMGMPAEQVPVQAIRIAYNLFGQRLMEAGAITMTDDRGEYRLYGIVPGRYYINAGSMVAASARSNGLSIPTPDVQKYVYETSYYPGIPELDRALALDVQGGDNIRADMSVIRGKRYHVSGRIVDSRTGKAPLAPFILLDYRSPNGGTVGTGVRVNSASGTFTFPEVVPAVYTLQAQIAGGAESPQESSAAQIAAEMAKPRASLPLKVTGDVENVVLTIAPPAVVEDRLTVNGEPLSNLPNLGRLRLGLRQFWDGGTAPAGPSALVSSDGAFRLAGVPADNYKFGISGLPAGYYVEKAELGGVDLLDQPIKVADSVTGALNVVLQRGTSAIQGTVKDAQSRPLAGAQVVLVPEQRKRLDLYNTAIADKSGRFTFSEVPPGNYRLFSWELIEPYSYYDPELLGRYEDRGQAIHLGPSTSATIDVNLIPLEP